jgi:hypothetical protein
MQSKMILSAYIICSKKPCRHLLAERYWLHRIGVEKSKIRFHPTSTKIGKNQKTKSWFFPELKNRK